MTQHFYTLAQAAAFTGLPENALMDLIEMEELSICFKFDGLLSGVSITHPDGKIEYAGLPDTELKGVLKSLGPPQSNDLLTAVLVEVVSEVGGRRVNRPNGILIPTEHSHGGFINAGARVTAFVDYLDIPADEWLFCSDDLLALGDDAKKGGAGGTALWKKGEAWSDERVRDLHSDLKKMSIRAAADKRGISHTALQQVLKKHPASAPETPAKNAVTDLSFTGLALGSRKKKGCQS
jgi:hypothetical protein